MNNKKLEEILKIVKNTALKAGEKILEVYNSNDFQVRFKEGELPFGLADELSNVEICKNLNKNFPDFGILTEEKIDKNLLSELPKSLEKSLNNWKKSKYTWVVDPLDGTKDFINKTGEFGVLIGLIENKKPILGLNYYPVSKTFYFATKGCGAYKEGRDGKLERIFIRNKSDFKKIVMLKSKTDSDNKILNKFIKDQKIEEYLKVGSLGLKACKVAEGLADLYVLLSNKPSIWDICSSQVIIEEAGGKVSDIKGKPIDYRPENTTRLSNGLIVANKKLHNSVVKIFLNQKTAL